MAKVKRVDNELEPAPVSCPIIIVELIQMRYDSFILFDTVPQPLGAKPSDMVFDIPALSFDRVHGGHVATSSFPLFQMPVELFSHVVKYLSTSDILALSKVDRDCRRLALLSAFKDVVLRYNPDKFNEFFHNTLSSTALQSSSSYIASCVRRLTVTAEPSNTVLLEYDDLALSKIDSSHFVESASEIIQKSYSNIHILDWDAPTLIPGAVLNSILASPVKHLRLKGATIHDDGSKRSSTSSSLQTLCFDVSFTRTKNRRAPLLFKDVLLSSRKTLRQLVWIGHLNDDEIDIDNGLHIFPRLRSLTLDIISFKSDQLIQSLLGPSTRVETLAMDSMTPSTYKFFSTRGYMPSLKRFCWLNHSQGSLSPYDTMMDFIRANSQIEELHIPGPASPEFIELSLLPSLRQEFNKLTSLYLVWDAPDIAEDFLESVASIATLRHLSLSAGNQNCLRNTWEVNHQSILTQLSPLAHLETFSLSHDTYKVNAHPLAPRSCDYYASRALPVNLDVSKYLSPAEFDIYQGKNIDFALGTTPKIEMRRLAWENWHAERMSVIATDYARHFPTLHWLFIGQLVFSADILGQLYLLHNPPRRDPYMTELQKRASMTIWRPI